MGQELLLLLDATLRSQRSMLSPAERLQRLRKRPHRSKEDMLHEDTLERFVTLELNGFYHQLAKIQISADRVVLGSPSSDAYYNLSVVCLYA
ncbi:unnamed protein product [Caretta caretta]